MAGSVSGIGTTFDLPNYHGELFSLTPSDTPLLSAIGGLTGGGSTTATKFEWQTYDLRDPQQRTRVEGAPAPGAENRVRAKVENVLQIHQEKVSVSYTKQAATGQYATPQSAPFTSAAGAENPVTNELDWQVEQALKQIALDVNYSFINGRMVDATTNAEARKTAGLLSVAKTNAVNKGTAITGSAATDTITATHSLANGDVVIFTDAGGSTAVVEGRRYYVVAKATGTFKVAAKPGGDPITLGTIAELEVVVPAATELAVDTVDEFTQLVFDNGGLTGGLGTFIVNSSQKRALTKAYANAYGKTAPIRSEKIGGVNVTQIENDFGVLNIMLDRHVPQDAIILASLDQLRPVFLNIPGKGVFFEEELAKTGASTDVQIYGEIGLEYGNELAHGVLRGLKV